MSGIRSSAAHQRERANLALTLPAPCVRCGGMVEQGMLWEADHIPPLAIDPQAPVYVAHRRCNRKAGGKVGANIKAMRAHERLMQTQTAPVELGACHWCGCETSSEFYCSPLCERAAMAPPPQWVVWHCRMCGKEQSKAGSDLANTNSCPECVPGVNAMLSRDRYRVKNGIPLGPSGKYGMLMPHDARVITEPKPPPQCEHGPHRRRPPLPPANTAPYMGPQDQHLHVQDQHLSLVADPPQDQHLPVVSEDSKQYINHVRNEIETNEIGNEMVNGNANNAFLISPGRTPSVSDLISGPIVSGKGNVIESVKGIPLFPFTNNARLPNPEFDGLPRYFPPPHPEAADSLGDHATEFIERRISADIRSRGNGLRWWQWATLQRMLERKSNGEWCWPIAFVSVSRQSGKTLLLGELALWRIAHPELFGGFAQDVLHTTRSVILSKVTQSRWWGWAVEEGFKVGRQLGDSKVEMPDGSTWRTAALASIWGRSADLVLLDECWSMEPAAFWSGLWPTLVEREHAQALLISCANEGAGDLVPGLRASDAVLRLEWGAPADADYSDPGVWRQAAAYWTPARQEACRVAASEKGFAAEWLNVWPEDIPQAARVDTWGSRLRGRMGPQSDSHPWQAPLTLAIERDRDGGLWGCAVSDGVHVAAMVGRDKSHVFDWLLGHAAQGDARELLCHEAIKRLLPVSITSAFTVWPVSVVSARAATAYFRDNAGQFTWQGVVMDQLACAEVGGGVGLEYVDAGKSYGSVSALKASMWALWRAALAPSEMAMIY